MLGEVGLRLAAGDGGAVVVAGVDGAWSAAGESGVVLVGDRLRAVDGEPVPAAGGPEAVEAAERRLRGEPGP
jgi:C-terminal processing protease CtpA/Prc